MARQYAGVIGKVENCQVGVYASLVFNSHSTLINERLFLPEFWTSDPKRIQVPLKIQEGQNFKASSPPQKHSPAPFLSDSVPQVLAM
ncbi:transposase [Thiocystis violacea]|uniref:transposase n=1 Tax=Thiocystis violacea TaxID=13725 RepID=UPI003B82F0E4